MLVLNENQLRKIIREAVLQQFGHEFPEDMREIGREDNTQQNKKMAFANPLPTCKVYIPEMFERAQRIEKTLSMIKRSNGLVCEVGDIFGNNQVLGYLSVKDAMNDDVLKNSKYDTLIELEIYDRNYDIIRNTRGNKILLFGYTQVMVTNVLDIKSGFPIKSGKSFANNGFNKDFNKNFKKRW